jgi:hypothetical protein
VEAVTDAEMIERMQSALDVESRDELEHVLACDDCYLFDQYDGGGPHFCLEFRRIFRGYVPPEQTAGGYVPTLWARTILDSMRRQRL